MPKPVVFAFPPAIELAPAPMPASWVIEGNPQARSKRLAESADGTSSVMVWSCTPGRFTWHYAVDETLHLLSGEVHVTDHNGEIRRLGAGDMAFFPAGSVSTWHVTKEVKKLAFCRHSMPRPCGYALRAWNKLVGIVLGTSEAAGALDSSPAGAEQARATAA